MLQRLNTETQQIACSGEIDETKSTRTWGKKAAEQMQNLNKGLQQHCRLAGFAQSSCWSLSDAEEKH